ncbi:tetratricopeptide repeat protein [Vibrio sp. SCSIO 43137]|uniref:tetratricopeptide repeat protein n=1 Tax=Vibrio sp. SCSIO 43137 TaxID=3021011 RepID=UPI002307FB5B|nr:tetratricopeptide repeat protein [Vibrio sp. SCSIO 43137]WCE32562.1 tetratricopeptide repeat protein [Vibrio sp. SCSIO 43137]
MNKLFFLVLNLSVLSGCSVNNKNSNSFSDHMKIKEHLLVSADNKQKLVEFYKDNLRFEPDYKLKLVELYLEMNDVPSAELYRNTYTKAELELPEYIFTSAEILYRKKNFKLAEKELQRYRKNGGNLDKYYLLHGKALAQSGKYQQGIEAFKESRKAGASDKEVNNNIAVVYMMQQDFTAADQILQGLYRHFPDDNKVRSNYLITLVHLKKYDVALNILKRNHGEHKAVHLLAKLMGAIDGSSVEENQEHELNRCIGEILHPATDTALDSKEANIPVHSSSSPERNRSSVKSVAAKKIYRIQVLVVNHKHDIDKSYLNLMREKYGDVYSHSVEHWRKYSIGKFSSFEEAKIYLQKVKVKGAFVVSNGHLYTKVSVHD